jgi:hypothetical protein
MDVQKKGAVKGRRAQGKEGSGKRQDKNEHQRNSPLLVIHPVDKHRDASINGNACKTKEEVHHS